MIMITVEAVLAAVEDCRRHEADDIQNNSPCLVWNQHTASFEPAVWSAVKVGDIVKVKRGESLPADVAVLGVHENDEMSPTGECYVETKSLDGETALKQRSAIESTAKLFHTDQDAAKLLGGSITAEAPNTHLHTFSGTISLPSTDAEPQVAIPIKVESLLLRGSSLQLTQHIWGVVVFTGHDTKVMMNSTKPAIKGSTIDAEINRCIIKVLSLMFSLCFICCIGGAIFDSKHDSEFWYLGVYLNPSTSTYTFGDYTWDAFLDFFSYWILISSFVSVSLVVSMVLVKAFQVYFMQNNIDMYHTETDTPMKVRTMNLNDELGVISFILSDKTGTLTDNIMQFRRCTVAGRAYGSGQTEIGRARKKRMNLSLPVHLRREDDDNEQDTANTVSSKYIHFSDKDAFGAANEEARFGEEHARDCREMYKAMAICHGAIRNDAVMDENGLGCLSAASPDELPLVEAAAMFGYLFIKRQKDRLTLQHPDGSKSEYILIQVYLGGIQQLERLSSLLTGT